MNRFNLLGLDKVSVFRDDGLYNLYPSNKKSRGKVSRTSSIIIPRPSRIPRIKMRIQRAVLNIIDIEVGHMIIYA
jgi:hypothetical protein